jgi:hypothetical protein
MAVSLHCEQGQDLVEYAVAFSLLILLLIGIIEFGVALMAYNSIANAAREGARYGIIRQQSTDFAGIEATARRSTLGLDQSALIITPSLLTDTIQVDVDYDHALMTPLIRVIVQAATGSSTLQLHTMASMRLE